MMSGQIIFFGLSKLKFKGGGEEKPNLSQMMKNNVLFIMDLFKYIMSQNDQAYFKNLASNTMNL